MFVTIIIHDSHFCISHVHVDIFVWELFSFTFTLILYWLGIYFFLIHYKFFLLRFVDEMIEMSLFSRTNCVRVDNESGRNHETNSVKLFLIWLIFLEKNLKKNQRTKCTTHKVRHFLFNVQCESKEKKIYTLLCCCCCFYTRFSLLLLPFLCVYFDFDITHNQCV